MYIYIYVGSHICNICMYIYNMCTKVGANSWKMGTLPDVFRAWTQCAGKDGAMFALRAVKEQACGQQDVILGYWDIYIWNVPSSRALHQIPAASSRVQPCKRMGRSVLKSMM